MRVRVDLFSFSRSRVESASSPILTLLLLLLDVKQGTDRMSDANREKRRPGKRQTGGIGLVEPESVIFMPSEPVTQDMQQVARIRRATVLPQSPADKHVIKGSMAKVIASGAGTSLQRRLLR